MWNCHVWKLHRFSASDPRNQRHCKSLQDSTEKHLSRSTATLVFPSLSQKIKQNTKLNLNIKRTLTPAMLPIHFIMLFTLKGPWHRHPTICSFQQKINVEAILCRYRYKKWVVKKCFRVKRAQNAAVLPPPYHRRLPFCFGACYVTCTKAQCHRSWTSFSPYKSFSFSAELNESNVPQFKEQVTMKQSRRPDSGCSQSQLLVTSWLASLPVLPESQAARMLLKMFHHKLSARPKMRKFHQLTCECSRINPHKTDYDKKLGVMAPLTRNWKSASAGHHYQKQQWTKKLHKHLNPTICCHSEEYFENNN